MTATIEKLSISTSRAEFENFLDTPACIYIIDNIKNSKILLYNKPPHLVLRNGGLFGCGVNMDWERHSQERFKTAIGRLPVFHRRIAEKAVVSHAEEKARSRNSSRVEEEDIVSAFFSGVPAPFYSMMIRLLEQTGFDYKKYGFPKK